MLCLEEATEMHQAPAQGVLGLVVELVVQAVLLVIQVAHIPVLV
jgi:hypothetical protein